RGRGHLGGDVGGQDERRARDRVLDRRVRTVRVTLVLANVLRPARREVAAEDEVRELQRRIVGVGTVDRRQREAHRRLHRTRPTDDLDRTRAQRRRRRKRNRLAAAGPAAQRRLYLVDGTVGVDVADEDECRAARYHPLTVQLPQ